MKRKLIVLLLTTLLALSLFGCGQEANTQKAFDIAAAHTGVDASNAVDVRSSDTLTDPAGNEIVVVEFTDDDIGYICKVDQKTQKVLSVSRNSVSSSETLSITPDEAKDTAVKDAGKTMEGVVFTKAKAEFDDGIYIYDIEFLADGREFEYEINAENGNIISRDIDREESVSLPDDGIDEMEAKDIALAHSGFNANEVTFTKVKKDKDDGIFYYDIEFVKDGIEYEYEIEAVSGAIVSADIDKDDILDIRSVTAQQNTNTSQIDTSTQTKDTVKDHNTTTKADNTQKPDTNNSGTSKNQSSQNTQSDFISKDKAIDVALNDAGFDKSEVIIEESSLDYDDGVAKYDIDFYAEGYDYDYDINAKTGDIIKRSKEKDDDRKNIPVKDNTQNDATTQTPDAGSTDAKENTTDNTENKPADPAPSSSQQTTTSSISLSEAKSIALKDAGVSSADANFRTAKKDHDDGRAYFEIEFSANGVEYEYEVSTSGKIIDKDVDRD